MDSEFDLEEEPTEEDLERIRFARLLTALSCPAATIHIDIDTEQVVEAAIAELTRFADEELSRIQYEDDLPEYEALLWAKCKDFSQSLRLDTDNPAITAAIGAIHSVFPLRAKLTPERDELIWRVKAVGRLHRAAKSFIANAYAKFPHVGNNVSNTVKRSTFAANLQLLIDVCDISVDEIANEATVNAATIYRWLGRQNNPSKPLLQALVQGCNSLLRRKKVFITLDDLYAPDFESRLDDKLGDLAVKAACAGANLKTT